MDTGTTLISGLALLFVVGLVLILLATSYDATEDRRLPPDQGQEPPRWASKHGQDR